MYHVANGAALVEYLIVWYFRPSSKSFPYVTPIGKSRPPTAFDLSHLRQTHRHSIGYCGASFTVHCYDSRIHQLFAFCRIPQTRHSSACYKWHLWVCCHFHVWTRAISVARWFRHPSYAGFFYWALGTQLVLQNMFTFVLFAVLLWRFFYYRTRGFFDPFLLLFLYSPLPAAEEAALIRFFGDDYVKYRKQVGTKIPFVP